MGYMTNRLHTRPFAFNGRPKAEKEILLTSQCCGFMTRRRARRGFLQSANLKTKINSDVSRKQLSLFIKITECRRKYKVIPFKISMLEEDDRLWVR